MDVLVRTRVSASELRPSLSSTSLPPVPVILPWKVTVADDESCRVRVWLTRLTCAVEPTPLSEMTPMVSLSPSCSWPPESMVTVPVVDRVWPPPSSSSTPPWMVVPPV